MKLNGYKKLAFIGSLLLSGAGMADVSPFSSDEQVVFIGDSITHAGSYHKNIYLYYATRFPENTIKYYNAGISGDTAVGTYQRFDEDIAIYQPETATIMLGMNDVARDLYLTQTQLDNGKQLTLDLLSQREAAKNRYLKHTRLLIEKLLKQGSHVVLIGPSIYDETAQLKKPAAQGINLELAKYAAALKQLAAEYNIEFVDFNRPMTELNQQMQIKSPDATLVGKDRVHPGPVGHFVMAYLFLKAQFLQDEVNQKRVASIEINANNKNEINTQNCPLVGDKLIKPDEVQFSCKQLSMPFPVTANQQPALDLVPFQEKFNQQILTVAHLDPGNYQLLIDNQAIAQFSADELAQGVDLSSVTNTPMYQQAVKIMNLNDKRFKLSAKLRNVAHVRYSMLSKYPEVDKNDLAAVKAALLSHVEQSKDKPWYQYLLGQVNNYFKLLPDESKMREEIERLFKQIYQVSKTKTHHWQLIKVN